MNPLTPIVLLFVGAFGCLAGLLRGFRYTGLIAVGMAFLATTITLLLGFRLPVVVTLSRWGPDTLLPVDLRLSADGLSWLLALGLLVVALAVFLTGISRNGGARVLPRAAGLVVVAMALTAIFSDSLVTLAVSWAALDAAVFTTLVFLSAQQKISNSDGPGASRAVLGLGLNVLATVMAIAAALEAVNAGSGGLLSGADLPPRAVTFLVLAAVLRLNVFPFQFGLAPDSSLRYGVGTILRLAPLAVGVDILAFVVGTEPTIPFHGWLTAGAGLAALLGALRWWSTDDPRTGLAYVVLAQGGLILLAALWGGAFAAAGVAAQGLALMLGGAALFLYNGYAPGQRGWLAIAFVGAAILVGFPLTIGFVGQWSALVGLAGGSQWVWFAIVIAAQVLLTAGYIRLAYWPGEALATAEPLVGVAYLFGLSAPILFAVVGGLSSGSIGGAAARSPGLLTMFTPSGFIALGAVLLSVLLGVALWFFDATARTTVGGLLSVLVDDRLGGAYTLGWDFYRFLRRTLRTTATILEGEGGVLWSFVIALLVWLAFRSG